MRLCVNGEQRDLADGATVLALLELLQVKPEHVAVERNRLVVRRATFAETILEDGDEIELLTFVGGG